MLGITRIDVLCPRNCLQPAGSLPVTEAVAKRTMGIPWFKHFRPQVIEEYALAFTKVATNLDEVPRG